MKKKIICFILAITLFTNFSFAHSHNETRDINPRSAIAISSTTATAILTLATYAGFTFHDSESFDEFLCRMIGLEQSVEFIAHVTALVKASVDGTIKFTKELVADFTNMVNKISLNKNMKYYVSTDGTRLPDVTDLSKTQMNTLIKNSSYKDYMIGWTDTFTDISTYTINGKQYTFDLNRLETNSDGTTYYNYFVNCDADFADSTDNCWYGSGALYNNMATYFIPVVYKYTANSTRFSILQISATKSGFYYDSKLNYCTKHSIESAYVEKEINATIGEAWQSGEGTVTPNDSDEGVTIKIPSSMDSLLDKGETDVSNPTYDTWTPGIDISIPSISNPSLEYTPDTSIDIPGTDTDNPGDTDTDNPGTDTDNPGDTETNKPWFDFGEIPIPKLDLTPLMTSMEELTERFPFSLPWDLERIIKSFSGSSSSNVNAPVLDIDFNGHNLVLDFGKFEPVALIVRGFIFTEVAIGLLYVLRRLKP